MVKSKSVHINNGKIGKEVENSKNCNGLSTVETSRTNLKKRPMLFPGFGIAAALLSAVFVTLNSLMVKAIDLYPAQITLSRCVVQFLILLPILQYKHKEVDVTGPEGLKILLWVRGIVGSTALILLYFTIRELSVGNAVTVSYLNMIIVPFMARIFLKEALTILDIIFAIISLIGVVLIARPTFIFPLEEGEQPESTIGFVYGISCATFIAGSIVIIRKLGPQTYPPLNILYYSVCGSTLTSVIVIVSGEFQYPCMADLPFVFLIGIAGLLGQLFLTLALQNERAGTVCVLRSIQIILVYVLQILVLGDIPSTLSLVGASLIFSTSIGIGVRKLVNEKRRRRQSVARDLPLKSLSSFLHNNNRKSSYQFIT